MPNYCLVHMHPERNQVRLSGERVLTSAVQEGKWVLIEDIDKAPTEVLSVC